MKRHFTNIGFVVTVLVCLLALGSTGALAQATPPAASARVFVGKVAESQAFIGLTITDAGLSAFVCDGQKDSISFWHWFTGKVENNSVELTTDDGESLSAQISGDTIAGTVTLDDKKAHSFKADLATGPAGLFRAEFTLGDVDYVGSWIRLSDGDSRGGIDKKKSDGSKPISSIFADGSVR